MAEVDTARFLADLNALRQIGKFRTGVHRPTYTPEDMESRRWLMDRMREGGLEPEMDGIGNVIGRHPGPGPKLLVGSHIETQNEAGWLDGALGVVSGVALARAGLPVDVIAFADEEGHYGGFIGSRSATGLLDDAEIDRLTNRYHGKPLREALREAGLEGRPRMRIDPARYKGFLEMHIEQGTQLESAGLRVGVVTGIVAIWQYRIVITGMQDHAGGTTMAERRDAGLTAVRLLARIDQEFPMVCGERSTWTCGRIALDPGAQSIIPGRAEVLFQFRDIDMPVLERMDRALRAIVQESNRRERCTAELRGSGHDTTHSATQLERRGHAACHEQAPVAVDGQVRADPEDWPSGHAPSLQGWPAGAGKGSLDDQQVRFSRIGRDLDHGSQLSPRERREAQPLAERGPRAKHRYSHPPRMGPVMKEGLGEIEGWCH